MQTEPHSSVPMPSARGRSLLSSIAGILLVAAAAQLLLFHTLMAIHQWQGSNLPSDPYQVALRNQFQSVAGSQNLELHFVGFPADFSPRGFMMCDCYYLANYALAPRQAWVGRGDRIINGAADIAAADVVPDDAWLLGHNVRAVETLISQGTGPQASVGASVRLLGR